MLRQDLHHTRRPCTCTGDGTLGGKLYEGETGHQPQVGRMRCSAKGQGEHRPPINEQQGQVQDKLHFHSDCYDSLGEPCELFHQFS